MDSTTGESSISAQLCVRFSLVEIQSATNNFDDELIIGCGGFGKVYKGCLYTDETRHVVAVKRMDSMSSQGAPEFRAEIEMLSKLRHPHLVSLIGFCDDNKEMILVYEYMSHGTLYDHLHKEGTSLSWVQRVKIVIGAARGLDYLHTGTMHGVIHRDVKSSNILLDENLEAKISDFGLSKIGPASDSTSYVDASVKGTFGYLDPEYFCTRKLTRKTDVYAFGVVLFEVLSGRLAVDERIRDEQYSLVRWAQKCVKERKLDQMVDPNIKGTISPIYLRRFTQIADRCVHSNPKERPTMTEVVASLQALLELQESSRRMGFSWKVHSYIVPPTKQNSSIHKLFIMGINMLNSLSARIFSDRNGTSSPTSLDNMKQHEELVITDVKMFTYDELKLCTRGFENETCLGEGRYGKVYKGWVDDTQLPIVVKKLHRCAPFDVEVLKNFRHPNLVKLKGYCMEDEILFLVYEFMHKGNLEELLHSGAVAQLPLVTKVKIVVEIARGIVFLEDTLSNRTWPRVSESPLYRHKILLDEDFTPKLSDYDITLLVDGQYKMAHPDPDGPGIVLESNLSGYEVVFMEVLTGERICNSNRALWIDLLFRQCGKVSLRRIAQLCFKICNEVGSKSKMFRILKEHDELIQRRMQSWLLDTQSQEC